jgi:hypothetical protein
MRQRHETHQREWHLVIGTMLKLVTGIVLTTPFGCEDIGAPAEPDLTIVFGESIATVRVGDSESDVVRKLGRPTYTTDGDFDGVLYYYTEGRLANLWVAISYDPGLRLGVLFVEAERPYAGLTKDGVGINSDRGFVLSKVGNPDTTHAFGMTITDVYDYPDNQFFVVYQNEHVLRIKMGGPERY